MAELRLFHRIVTLFRRLLLEFTTLIQIVHSMAIMISESRRRLDSIHVRSSLMVRRELPARLEPPVQQEEPELLGLLVRRVQQELLVRQVQLVQPVRLVQLA